MSDELSKLLTSIDKVIRQDDPDSEGAFTTVEAAKAWGVNRMAAYVKIIAACDAGLIEPVMAPKRNRHGVVRRTECYRVMGKVR